MLSVVYTECVMYARCLKLAYMLNVIMLNVTMLSAVMMNVLAL
jgi:hypothetical protein